MFIYSAEAIRRADEEARKQGMDAFTLMEVAGREVYLALSEKISKNQEIAVLAGKGNNGGDGIVAARYLKENGYSCRLMFPDGEPLSEYAIKHLNYFRNRGFEISEQEGHADVIVDSLLGTGTKLPLSENLEKTIKWANEANALRAAIDIPSGVEADNGKTGTAFRADLTLTLHGYKPSAFLEGSTEYYGEIQVLDIGLPHDSAWQVWTKEKAAQTFRHRSPGAHKGSSGTGLLLAGSDEMPGSAMLASLGAMRSGIGKLVVGTTRFASGIISARVPECTFVHDGLKKAAAGDLPKGIKAAAIGPGLDDQENIEEALRHLFAGNLPIILDAGALKERRYPSREAEIIVTPHPGEFSKMTGLPIAEIGAKRLTHASDYAKKHGIIVVLKGRNTVIAYPDGSLIVNRSGNAGLAKGGTGDTLTGIILAMISSQPEIKTAIANAVYFHGASADFWSEDKAPESMLATDVSESIASVIKNITR
ncbi:NAD(P)H-hydrate dehydratase [Bacillus sp. MUM 13]|uniref:NAD(P)H-hydrate dehydratase n=1 Tax=Bacillus sp. MUM 13 TaxID=1678001 RepID=UPI0008F5ABF4|nr:NAD(P)H-hydrate dehydratase [Bacillus sp. MUM 13]OIK10486.1 bifunctional ADP-dependent (S)-NAD(P)H-hydrate dehydratase/NAD(P)H-hydrate epimerase [Bacillus sp. MUM 13]